MINILMRNINWVYNSPGLMTAEFTINERRYVIHFAGSRHISIQFESPRGQGITGEGNAYRVFSTIYDILINYVSNHKPEIFSFSARKSQPSRVKLYTTITKRLEKLLPDYETEIDDGDRDVDFIFRKI